MTFERPNIARMRGYSYGEQPESPGLIKLNTNESAYPPSPAVQAALQRFDCSNLRRYPNALATPFREAIAELHAVGTDNVMVTNGGDEALRLAVTTFVNPGGVFATYSPSYSLYPVLAAVQDARVMDVPLTADFGLPAEPAAAVNAAGADLTCVVNPHAPSGRLFSAEAMRALADAIDGVLLIDEAYVDFVDPAAKHDLAPLALTANNVLLLRSMSKGYGLAGLRCGYLIGNTELIRPMLEKTRDSYNVDAIAQALAAAALSDQNYSRTCWQNTRAHRDALRDALLALGFRVPPSQANFLLAQTGASADAARLFDGLRERGVLVRYFSDLPDRLRITVGLPEEHERLLSALRELLGQ